MAALSFIALGDMPYRKKDLPAFHKLIMEINSRKPRFVVHLGDMKSGRGSFKKNFYATRKDLFAEIEAPFIYTPGDNDWVDGKAASKELGTARARLKRLRQTFYGDAENDIDSKLWIIRQETFVENTWWTMNDILFVTLHTIGNNNNRAKNRTEFEKRNSANMEWLQQCVGEAPHRALVIFTHANLWHPSEKKPIQTGFIETIDRIGLLAQDLSVPVLVMHGDKHKLILDHPVARPSNGLRLSNLTRAQVMGDDDIRALEVTVRDGSAVGFEFHPITPA